MEGSSYVDIFATKGVEYLLVIVFLLMFVFFWKLLTAPREQALALSTAGPIPATGGGWFRFDEGRYYHQGHSWMVPETDEIATVGIDDFAQKLLGKPGSIKLPQIGSRLQQGERAWQFEILSKSIDVLSPVSGEVLAVNHEVLEFPELLAQDPFERGWLLKVKVPKMSVNFRNLLSGRLASAWMEETVNKLRNRMGPDLGVVMQDGGLPVDGFARSLSEERWDEIATDFLMSG